jgi:hypothetical protein
MLVLLMTWVYEVRHHIHTKFHKDWFRHSEVVGRVEARTDTQIHEQQGDVISVLLFFQTKKRRLKEGGESKWRRRGQMRRLRRRQ